ncbi:MAG: dihydroxyacetone kinase phosphoryl donor subunit DhaM [Actinomycetes bacterium]
MVGVVLVSHSPRLAAGVAELLDQLVGDTVRVRCAAGTSDGRLGTSVDLVVQAVRDADAGQGVVLLPDLGSAVMACRLALEEADPDRTVLVDAPFVEGAVAAVVTASTGAELGAVVTAAEQARVAAKL